MINPTTRQIVQEIEYDEYGNMTKNTDPQFQPLTFAGGLWDSDTKFIRFGARDYDPTIGRWTTKDPIGFDGGDTNLYAYVGQNPMSLIDPTGLRAAQERMPFTPSGGAPAGGACGTSWSAPATPVVPIIIPTTMSPPPPPPQKANCQQQWEKDAANCRNNAIINPSSFDNCLKAANEAYRNCVQQQGH